MSYIKLLITGIVPYQWHQHGQISHEPTWVPTWWVQRWPEVCSALSGASRVVAYGERQI